VFKEISKNIVYFPDLNLNNNGTIIQKWNVLKFQKVFQFPKKSPTKYGSSFFRQQQRGPVKNAFGNRVDERKI
jgi:hypothetical protein